jgi:NADH-quinone oxidoreductase subunit J
MRMGQQPAMINLLALAAPLHNPRAIVLPVVLGLLAVYLLLPRPKSFSPLWGGASAALALLLAGGLLIRPQIVLPELILFYAFSTIAIVSAGLLVTQRNPVRAALSFALVVLSTCGLFLLQAAPFLMAATIIIYAGAIIVTFIFVIMLAQQEGQSDADHRSREPFLSCVAGFVLLGALLWVLQATYMTSDFDKLLQRIALASQVSSVDEIQGILHDKANFEENFQSELGSMHLSNEEGAVLSNALNDVAANWDAHADPVKLKEALSRLYQAGVWVRNGFGSLQPPADLPLSTFSRLHAANPGPGQPRSSLPAENVAYLGRTLFSDYLLAVELGGTLLLVATIGAIAISGRRPEGQP